ncbi:hypothetical protein BGW80DRAFT_1354356 [Lactifluus volemus]|nr:hypothetical protein BGW80DRAFT_1354356 [Lactifluus volemus]
MRTALGNLGFSLTVLRLFDHLFYRGASFLISFLFTPVMSQSFIYMPFLPFFCASAHSPRTLRTIRHSRHGRC